jgi:benzoate/toluate 1,2-dioxygenase alpha subunit
MRDFRASDLVLDDPQKGLFGVRRDAFTDPGIFERELTRVFEGNWVYLAHESQLAKPGDFLSVTIGRRPLLLMRGDDGTVRAFYNACAHRGSALVATERGNRKALVCPYHGWTFDNHGRNVHIKDHPAGGYGEGFAAASHDLTPIARTESYRGFIWGSLQAAVPPLAEFLGAARGFIDLLADQSADGLEVLKGSATYRFRGNWKLQAENGVDGYHFGIVHQNYVRVLQHRGARARRTGEDEKLRAGFDRERWGAETGWYDLGHGHAAIWLNIIDPPGRPLWERREELVGRIGQARADWLLMRQRNLFLFPNVQLMDQNSTQIRVFQPIAPDLTEVRIHCFAPRGESAAARELRIRQYEDFFNASGMATPDDLAVFESVQAGCTANGTLRQSFDRGLGRPDAPDARHVAPLGVTAVAAGTDVQDENLYAGMYREWSRLMSDGGS